MGDHTEALQVDYDPGRISFEELLDYIWESHNPFRQAFSRQYMNLIFYHDEEQQRLVLESLERLEREQNRKVATNIHSLYRVLPGRKLPPEVLPAEHTSPAGGAAGHLPPLPGDHRLHGGRTDQRLHRRPRGGGRAGRGTPGAGPLSPGSRLLDVPGALTVHARGRPFHLTRRARLC